MEYIEKTNGMFNKIRSFLLFILYFNKLSRATFRTTLF